MRRLFNFLFGALAMFAVALLSAFVSMRLAIHGREVTVPNLSGMSVAQATATTAKLGLVLSMQNRFYSTAIPSGRILTQSPAPGSVVRRDSQLRVAESLGGQHVTIPNVVGQQERAASLVLRRLTLELGTVAHIPAPASTAVATAPTLVGDNDAADLIIAQSPSPNSAAATSPRVSFLVAAPQPAPEPEAFVMPSLVGLNMVKATTLLASAGLHIASSVDPTAQTAAPPIVIWGSSPPAPQAPAATPPAAPTAPRSASWNAVIVSQTPLAGHRITRSDSIRVTAIAKASTAPTL